MRIASSRTAITLGGPTFRPPCHSRPNGKFCAHGLSYTSASVDIHSRRSAHSHSGMAATLRYNRWLQAAVRYPPIWPVPRTSARLPQQLPELVDLCSETNDVGV
jgi:hypothetical protein